MRNGLKKILAALLAVALVMTMSFTALADSTPLIYKVSDDDGHEIYMLGTIHVGEESMYPIQGIDDVLDRCDVVAFELDETDLSIAQEGETEEDIDFWELAKELLSLVDFSGNSLDDETLQRMSQIEGLESISIVAPFVKLSALASLVECTIMENVGISSERGVEMYLMQLAHDRGMKILGLETAEEQDAVLDSA